MNGIFKGVRPLDYVLAGLMTVAGAFLMYENIAASGDGLPHAQSTTVVAGAAGLRARRRCRSCGAAATSSRSSGSPPSPRPPTCSRSAGSPAAASALPLTFALAYAVGRFAGAWKNHLIGLAGIVVTQLVMIARDASIDTMAGALPLALPIAALFYGIGLLVQNRVSKKQSTALAPVIERAAA